MDKKAREQVFDAAVIGAGVNGSGAALYLAKAGKTTVLIEQFPIPHSRGSSAGASRIIRYANYGHQSVSPLMRDSFDQWRRLEKETGTTLLIPSPFFTYTRSSDQQRIRCLKEDIEKSQEVPVWWNGDDMNREYNTSFPSDTIFAEDANAGILLAEKGVLAIQKRFVEIGGLLIDTFPVEGIYPEKNGIVKIRSRNGEIQARNVILCAGPWSSKLLEPLGLHLPLQAIRVGVFYWRVKEKNQKTFTFVNFDDRFQHIYGLPAIEYPDMVKIAVHDGVAIDPDLRDAVDSLREEQEVERFVRTNIPWVHPKPVIRETCMYTMTPDKEAIIDRHPLHKNIFFACGFSGTGFKTGLTVGQVLSEMVQGKRTSFDMSAFKADRFPNIIKKTPLAKL